MIGHECRLSRTNTNGVVWVCQCGEIGDVTPMPDLPIGAKRRLAMRIELAESVARKPHGAHLKRARADVAARSDAELARIGRLIPFADATQQHRGRWGHP